MCQPPSIITFDLDPSVSTTIHAWLFNYWWLLSKCNRVIVLFGFSAAAADVSFSVDPIGSFGFAVFASFGCSFHVIAFIVFVLTSFAIACVEWLSGFVKYPSLNFSLHLPVSKEIIFLDVSIWKFGDLVFGSKANFNALFPSWSFRIFWNCSS